jgi:hypothetical protein
MSMDELQGIASGLRTWTGDAAVAAELRERVRNLGEVRGKLTDPAERAVQIAGNLLRGRKNIDRYFDRDDAAPYLAFLLGAERQGAASYHDPATVDDTQALFWLAYLREHPVLPDRRMIDFVSAMFRVRPRQLWVTCGRRVRENGVVEPGDREGARRPLQPVCRRSVDREQRR